MLRLFLYRVSRKLVTLFFVADSLVRLHMSGYLHRSSNNRVNLALYRSLPLYSIYFRQ